MTVFSLQQQNKQPQTNKHLCLRQSNKCPKVLFSFSCCSVPELMSKVPEFHSFMEYLFKEGNFFFFFGKIYKLFSL